MEDRAHGIILRTRLLTDTSLIVQLLTAEFGRLSLVAKGARRPKSPFTGKLDLYYEANFTFQRSKRSDLHLLKEIKLVQLNPNLRKELPWLAQAAYASQLIESLTETETPMPEVFELLQTYLVMLPDFPPNRAMPLSFEFKLFDILGMGPNSVNLSSAASKITETLMREAWKNASALSISHPIFNELNRLSLMTLSQVTQKIPTSRAKALMMK